MLGRRRQPFGPDALIGLFVDDMVDPRFHSSERVCPGSIVARFNCRNCRGQYVIEGHGRSIDINAFGNALPGADRFQLNARTEEHTSELQSLMPISYPVFCL